MKRRSFVKSTLLSGAAAAVIPATALSAHADTAPFKGGDYYELRTYTLKNATQQKLVEDYFQYAAIPALNRIGA
jgi:FtsP/CotA-like multicopper oxidase with cupredoxin domain